MDNPKITQSTIRAALAKLRRAGGLVRLRPPSPGGIPRPGRGGYVVVSALRARLGLTG